MKILDREEEFTNALRDANLSKQDILQERNKFLEKVLNLVVKLMRVLKKTNRCNMINSYNINVSPNSAHKNVEPLLNLLNKVKFIMKIVIDRLLAVYFVLLKSKEARLILKSILKLFNIFSGRLETKFKKKIN